jgi:ECF sigma factor
MRGRVDGTGTPRCNGPLGRGGQGRLRQLAGRYMNRERTDHTLQATAVVHGAYLKLVLHPPVEWQNRTYFFDQSPPK